MFQTTSIYLHFHFLYLVYSGLDNGNRLPSDLPIVVGIHQNYTSRNKMKMQNIWKITIFLYLLDCIYDLRSLEVV